MRRSVSFLIPSPAMGVALAAALAATAGLAVAASSSSGVIRACANKKTGALRIARKCRHGERSVSWSKAGPAGRPGPAGATGATGAAGAAGAAGPQGPGATTFETTLPEGTGQTPLRRLSDGLTLEARCSAGGKSVAIFAYTNPVEGTVQAVGTVFSLGELLPVHLDEGATDVGAAGEGNADIDVIARAGKATKFERIDFHGSSGSTCRYWGMVTPSG
jgi:hypothetical protein